MAGALQTIYVGAMDASHIAPKLRLGVPYIIPVLAALLLLQLMLEAKYLEGWFAAQGCNHEKGCVLGRFDPVEYGVIGACVIASFALVGLGRSLWGNCLAAVVALLTAMAWIGMTR